jgi:formylglycine-generating enzyme required for sulfatase activity
VPPKLVNIDCTYANYGGGTIGLADRCSPRGTNNVGSESPKGDGKWGHSDLGGNVWEWVLDYGTGGPCIDCAYTTPPPSEPPPAPPDANVVRSSRGGGLGAGFSLEASSTSPGPPTDRNIEQGARCARVP